MTASMALCEAAVASPMARADAVSILSDTIPAMVSEARHAVHRLIAATTISGITIQETSCARRLWERRLNSRFISTRSTQQIAQAAQGYDLGSAALQLLAQTMDVNLDGVL